jgi:adenosylmethionine-8-amino-7-oxononanoate aminotransferase
MERDKLLNNVMSPPLMMSRDDVDFVVSTLRDSISATVDQLRAEGRFPPCGLAT